MTGTDLPRPLAPLFRPLALVAAAALVLAGAPAAPASPRAASPGPAVTEREVAFTVVGGDGSGAADAATRTVRATVTGPTDALEDPGPLQEARAVALLLPGPGLPGSSSGHGEHGARDLARALAGRGHATVTVDRLGPHRGRPGRTGGGALGPGDVDAVRQVVGQLRSGGYAVEDGEQAHAFEEVVLAGGVVARVEAHSAGDVAGLLVLPTSGEAPSAALQRDLLSALDRREAEGGRELTG